MKTRKAVLLGVLAVAVLAALAWGIPQLVRIHAAEPGGKEAEPGETTPADGEEAPVPARAAGFVARYIRTDGYHEDVQYPVVKLIRSAQELEEYYEANRDRYSMDGFASACDRYDEAYFRDRILLLVLTEAGSGSVRYQVADVEPEGANGDELAVAIDVITPEVGTCDMAEWHILIEPEAGVDVEDEDHVTVTLRSAAPVRSSLAFCAADGVSAALRIPEGWTVDIDRNEDPNSGIVFSMAFRPADREGCVSLHYSRFLGVCGTGLKQKQVRLAGYEAWQGTYDGKKDWDFFTIGLGEGPEGISIWNEGMSAWSKEERKEAREILETLEIGDGHPTEEQVIEIAKAAVTVPYDYARALYNEQENAWTVAFGRRNYAGGGQLVTLNADGEIVDSTWGE